jgi:hypothetical protein
MLRFPFAAYAARLRDEPSRDTFARFVHYSPIEVVLGFLRDQEGTEGTLYARPKLRHRPR